MACTQFNQPCAARFSHSNQTYEDDGLSEDTVDLSSHGGLVLEVGVRADEVLERLVVRIEAAITKGVVEDGLAPLLVGTGDTDDVEDGHVLGEG